MNHRNTLAATFVALLVAWRASSAGELTVPNSFSAGTPARAAQVNANFEAVATAVNDNAARVEALETKAAVPNVAPAGNLLLVASTATAGNVLKNGQPFLHNFGAQNTFLGELAGNLTMTGTGNTGIGQSALLGITTGIENTAIGNRALGLNGSGRLNTAVGSGALAANQQGFANTAVGYNALRSNTTYNNTAVGSNALASNTEGNLNVAVGADALFANTTGTSNTAHGSEALTRNTTGNANTAHGTHALLSNTTGNYNTAVGVQALSKNTTAERNTALGQSALLSNTTGNGNTATGTFALQANTTGAGNAAYGLGALTNNTTGAFNTAVGDGALGSATTGNSNIALGIGAGIQLTTGSDNIDIAHQGVAGEARTIRIGTAAQTRAFIAGIRGVTTGAANAVTVVVDGNGQLGTVSSSRSVKDHIVDMHEASDVLARLRPVTFYYRSDQHPAGRSLQYGLVAEEVAEVAPELVARSSDGAIETVYYQFLPPMLLNEWQKQQRTIATLEARVAELERTLQGERQ